MTKKKKSEQTLVSDILLHENGLEYKELEFISGEKIKLFNTNKPQRLEAESQLEYRIRRKLNNTHLKEFLNGTPVYYSASGIPYVKPKTQETK